MTERVTPGNAGALVRLEIARAARKHYNAKGLFSSDHSSQCRRFAWCSQAPRVCPRTRSRRAPSGRHVARGATRSTISVRSAIHRYAAVRAHAASRQSGRRPPARGPSVGSSRISSAGSPAIARAIASICCSPPDKTPAGTSRRRASEGIDASSGSHTLANGRPARRPC